MACVRRQVLARHPWFGEGLFRSFTPAGEGEPWLGGSRLQSKEPCRDGKVTVGCWGGLLTRVPFSCHLPSPAICEGLLLGQGQQRGRKLSSLTSCLLFVSRQRQSWNELLIGWKWGPSTDLLLILSQPNVTPSISPHPRLWFGGLIAPPLPSPSCPDQRLSKHKVTPWHGCEDTLCLRVGFGRV